MASEQAHVEVQMTHSKYSERVILKTILGRGDGGVGLIGQRLVIGGWVKSSREVKKEPEHPLVAAPQPTKEAEPKDVSCVEVVQSRLPFFRSILKVLVGGEHRVREKLESVVPKPPQPSIVMLRVSDGSCVSWLQVVVESVLATPSKLMPTGTCILVEGILQRPSMRGKQVIELKVEKILHVGPVDEDRYPLSKKSVPLEMLRDCPHFRPRTTTVASVMRIRSALTAATHTFFEKNGFLYVQVPVITITDCEGSGEAFQVTTLLGKGKSEERIIMDDSAGVKLESIKASIKEKSKQVEELKRSDSNREALAAAIQDLKKTAELVSQLEAREKGKSVVAAKPDKIVVAAKPDKINFSKDFFARQTYLTVSGRLHLESYACALGNVYTFGPRFRADKTESKKALAETWMVELEMAFSRLEDAMDCANDFLKFMCKWILENCGEDLTFVSKRIDKAIVHRLQLISSGSFARISYSEAVNVLQKVREKKFDTNVQWGVSLSEEHESYLAEEMYKRPVIIYNHPKEVKPFYVRLNDDGRTVAAFDVIVPKVGTLIKGSQNEERFDLLSTRITDLGLAKQQFEWYLELRKQGMARCSGFSFLFDSLVLYATGLNDVRDAVPFPRSFGKASN